MRRCARPKIQIGKQCHLQSAARGKVFKIETVRRNQKLCAEKSGLLATKSPGYVGVLAFQSFSNTPCLAKKSRTMVWAITASGWAL